MEHLNTAFEIIKKFEGFAPRAVWDVNAYRLGYGSDTITNHNGTFRKVLKTDTTNASAAKLDLIRRIKDFDKAARIKVGGRYWDALHNNVKAALLSLAYNYGSINKRSVINAIKTGNSFKIAEALILSTSGDNKRLPTSVQKALLNRRKKEAEIIKNSPNATNLSSPPAASIIIPALFALLVGAWLLK